MRSESRIATIEASEILQGVAGLWVHRFQVRYDAMTAEIALDQTELIMTADGDSLVLALEGDERSALDAAKAAVETHVRRVAKGVDIRDFNWVDEP